MTQRDFEPLPYYRWYWRDYRASRAVQKMAWEARGIYRDLLDECWVAGSIPDLTSDDNAATLADITGTTPDIMRTWWPQLRTHFRRRGRKLVSPRIEHERKRAMELHDAKSDAGKRGAESRWGGKNGTANSTAIALPRQNMASSSSNRTKQSSNRQRALGPETGPRSPVLASEVLPEFAHLLTPPTRLS